MHDKELLLYPSQLLGPSNVVISLQQLPWDVREALGVSIEDWLDSRPGELSSTEERLASIYPFTYNTSLNPT